MSEFFASDTPILWHLMRHESQPLTKENLEATKFAIEATPRLTFYERKVQEMCAAFLKAFPDVGVVNSHWRCPVVVDEALDPQEWKLLGLSEQIGDTVPPKMDIGDFRSGK